MYSLYLYNTILKSIFLFMNTTYMTYKYVLNMQVFFNTIFSEIQVKFFTDLVDYPTFKLTDLSVYNIKVIMNQVNFLQTGLLYHYIGIILFFILYSIYFIILVF